MCHCYPKCVGGRIGKLHTVSSSFFSSVYFAFDRLLTQFFSIAFFVPCDWRSCANFDFRVRSPKWPYRTYFSGTLLASDLESVRDSLERRLRSKETRTSCNRWPFLLPTCCFRQNQNNNDSQICNMIHTFNVFRKYITKNLKK